MNIKTIRGSNFRGQNFTREIGPVTLLVGDNFAGKSTVPDAIRFALSGYLPGIGKTAPLLWNALAGNPEESGAVEVEAVFGNGRTSKVSLSRTPKGAVSQEGAPAGDLALDPMLLDPRAFFAMTEAERTATIFRAAGTVPLNPDSISAKLWEIEAQPVAVRDELLREICDSLPNEIGKYGDEWTEVITDVWKDRVRHAKAEAKISSGAFAGMKLPQQMPKPADGLAELRVQRDVLLQRRGELLALLKADSRKAQLAEKIRVMESELIGKKGALVFGDPGPEPQEPEELKAYRTALPALGAKRLEVTALEHEVTRRTAELDALQDVTICPTCGANGSLDKVRERMAQGIDEVQLRIGDIIREVATLENTFDLEAVGELDASFQCAKEDWGEAMDKRRTLTHEVATAEKTLAELRAELEKVTGDREAQIAALTKEVEGLAAVEAKLNEADGQQRAFENYERLLRERSALEVQILRQNCEIEVLTKCGKVLTEIIAAESEEAFGKVLKLSAAFTDGLLNSPLEFRDGELGRRCAEADVHAGRVAPEGAWIPQQSFSGTESLLAMAGFSVALARLAPFKLVVLDELGRLTEARREAVAQRMVKLVADGTVHQVIMIDAAEDGPSFAVPKGVEVVEL